MAFPSPSLQPNPNPPFRRPILLLHRTLLQTSFKLPFPVVRTQTVPFTSETTSTSHDDKDNKPNTKKKKKRKPRPSFLEETMDRWSVKIPSKRDALPWENKNSELKKNSELRNSEFDGGEVNTRLDSIVEKLNVDLESAKSDRLNDLSCEGSDFDVKTVGVGLGNPLISAPWLQGETSPWTSFDSSEKNDNLKQNFEFEEQDERTGEEDLVEEEISERPGFKGAKLKNNFDSSENNYNLKQNFEFEEKDERTGEEDLVEEEISERPAFKGAKLKNNFDSSENNYNLKQNFEFEEKDERTGEEDLVEEEISERPAFKGAKLKNNFDSSENNYNLKQNFEFEEKDERTGEEDLVEEEISERPAFKGAKLKNNFDSSENNYNLKQNFELDQKDERTGEEDLVEEEISEIPNFEGPKLKEIFYHDEEIDMPEKFKHSIDSKRMNVKNDPSIGGKSKDKPRDKPQVDFITNNPNFFMDSSFSSQSENEINSNPDFEDTELAFPTQIHELRTKNQKINTNFDKPRNSKDQPRSNLSNSTHFSNPKPKTPDNLIPNLTVNSVTLPWLRSNDEDFLPIKTNTELAERTIPELELKRLRDAALRLKERLKVGPAGVTESLVELIHEKWEKEEVVKLRFEGPPSLNMKRVHHILEEKSGGIVIWRSGRTVALFRGMTYTFPCVQSFSSFKNPETKSSLSSSKNRETESSFSSSKNRETESSSSSSSSIESLLDGLGPRYRDWSGRDPVPVDADLLPGSVPGYAPPGRMLSHRTRRTLRDHQMTSLRRRARNMPPHFALGRNREHQGLAAAIVKLWEKSAVAKIAIKRGVPNTSNERMAEEIKKLTGGTLISRNKEYIVLYRGNDFVTPSLRSALLKKQQEAVTKLDEEESARLKALDYSNLSYKKSSNVGYLAGTLAETREAKLKWRNQLTEEEREEIRRDLAMSKHASLVRFLERKLYYANVKIEKAEKALAKVQVSLIPAELPTDLETLTDEERSKFRSIGLKMKAFGFLGRRGVFDGTVQNMHLNWKNKELIKVIVKRKSFAQVKHIAINLEAESGGVLVSVDKTTKGHAIVLYRGKNYMRPHILRPKNLLSKRQALARSIELQRREALMSYMAHLQKKIETLKLQLEEMKAEKGIKNGERILQENDTCSDDDIEEEGDEAYLKTYTSDTDEEDDDGNSYNDG